MNLTQAQVDSFPTPQTAKAGVDPQFIAEDDRGIFLCTYVFISQTAGWTFTEEPVEIIEELITEISQNLKSQIRAAFKNLNLSASDKIDLVNRVLLSVYFSIDDADLPAARFMAFNTAVGGAYTTNRKNQLVAMIDAAILTLP